MNAGLRTPPRTPLRVHAAEQKRVCQAGGPIDRRIDDGARLENGEEQVRRDAQAETFIHARARV